MAILESLQESGTETPQAEAQGKEAKPPPEWKALQESSKAVGLEEGIRKGREEAERELQERQRQQYTVAQQQAFQRQYYDLVTKIDSDATADRFLEANDRTAVKALLAEIKADADKARSLVRQVAGFEDQATTVQMAVQFNDALFSAMPPEMRAAVEAASPQDSRSLWDAVKAHLHEGRYTKAQADEQTAIALVNYREKGIKEGWIIEAGTAPERGSAAATGGWTYERYMRATPEERRALPPSVEQQIIRDEQRRRGA